MTVRLLPLDSFKFRVMGKLLEDAAADVVTLCTLGVHPGAGTDHVPLNREYILQPLIKFSNHITMAPNRYWKEEKEFKI